MICKVCEKTIEHGMNINVTAMDTKTGEIVEIIPNDVNMCYGCYACEIPLIGITILNAIYQQQG